MDHNIVFSIVRPVGAMVLFALIALLARLIEQVVLDLWRRVRDPEPRRVEGTWLPADRAEPPRR
jgi:hypothetical protein